MSNDESGPVRVALDLSEVMWATMKPNMYGGENCDQPVPMWDIYCDGDKEGDLDTLPIIMHASNFPPGTRLVVSIPQCPHCGVPCAAKSAADMGPCECGKFDWRGWMEDEFS